MGQLMVGASRRNITPPVGAWMAGFGNRDHGAECIHDELHARVTVLDDGNTQAAIVCRDLCFSGEGEMDLLADMVREATGLEREQLFVADSHTHSGPTTDCGADSKNRVWVENLAGIIAGAIVEAQSAMRPAQLRLAQRPVQCGINRREKTADGTTVLGRNPDGPCDTVVDIACLQDAATGEPLVTLFRHAAHAVVMGSDSYAISADYPGAAAAFVERNTPGVASFLCGCCGNINADPREGFENVAMLGRRLGSAVCQGLTELDEPRADVTLACVRHDIELPVEPMPPAEESRAIIAELEPKMQAIEAGEEGLDRWGTERGLRHARERLATIESGEEITGKKMALQALAIGEVALIGYPCEVFFQIGEAVAAASPFVHTLTVTHAGGWNGYIPTADAYPDGGYEVDRARANHMGLGILPESETIMVEESLKALGRAKASVG